MELVYSIGKAGRFARDGCGGDNTLCSLSTRNVIAFTSTLDLLDDGVNQCQLTTYKVYVCDLDSPYNVYRVTSSEEPLVAMEWEPSGVSLLLADTAGNCQIWVMKNHLMNDWQQSHSVKLTGETIVSIAWLHRGSKVNFMAEKKDAQLYSEKIVRSAFSPSLCQIGGMPIVGFVAVTATGMVYIGIPSGTTINCVSETLGLVRKHIAVADVAFDSSGEILIIGSDGNLNSAIHCFRLSLRYEQMDSCSVTVHACRSFYVQCHADILLKSPTAKITHIKFRSRERGDSVVVAAGDSKISKFEQWHLKQMPIQISRPLVTSTTDNLAKVPVPRWICVASIQHGSLPVSVAVPRFPVMPCPNESLSSQFLQCFAISYKDGALKLINANTFQPIATTNLDTGAVETDTNDKRRKVIPYMVVMQQTFSGCGIIGLDQFCTLYVMKAINTRDPVTQMSPSFIVSMFEYMLVTSQDWWDVLLALRPGMIENVVQKLTDHFDKQPLEQQELLYARFMSIRASLYSNAISGQQRAVDTLTKVVIHSISLTFKTIIRPKSLMPHEKDPFERLVVLCSGSIETDLSKVMLSLGGEADYAVEPAILQSIQQLVQWICEISLTLLATLPLSHGYSNFPGSSILKDSKIICTLREILVLVRIWGSVNSNCLPHITTMSTFDVVSSLYKLLTKVWQSLKDGTSFEHDDSLMDECCSIPGCVFLPGIDQFSAVDLGQTGTILSQSHTCKFSFGIVPEFIKHSKKDMILYGNNSSSHKRDIVRLISLGTSPGEEFRQCSRCSSFSLTQATARSSVMKIWEQYWTRMCICGGHWKLHMPDS